MKLYYVAAILLLLLQLGAYATSVSNYRELTDTVDRIEVNNFHVVGEEDGGPVYKMEFSQYIFWDLEEDGNYHVVDWRLRKTNRFPYSDGSGCVLRFYDAEPSCQCYRTVRAKYWIETDTNFDRELTDRCNVPQDQRRKLRPAHKTGF